MYWRAPVSCCWVVLPLRDDPAATFERLSDGHPGIITRRMRRESWRLHYRREKGSPSIGPEKCATIHSQYHIPQCAACPHLHLGTTPLSVQFKRPNGHAYTGAAITSPNSIDLPLTLRGNDNLIYKSITDGEGNTELVLVLPYQIIPGSAHVEFGIPFQIVLTTVQGGSGQTVRQHHRCRRHRLRQGMGRRGPADHHPSQTCENTHVELS